MRPRKTAVGPGCPQVQGCYRNKGRDEFICWWSHFLIASLFFISEIGNEAYFLRGKPEQDRRLRPTVLAPSCSNQPCESGQASFPISKVKECKQIPVTSFPAWRL